MGALRKTDHHEGFKVAGASIHLAAMHLVAPETATEDHWMSLSNLDRVMNPTFSSAIFFYQEALAKRTFKDLVVGLKTSLAKVLVDFYPMAGRLKLRDESGKVDLHCNDAGVVLVEASVDSTLADLGGPQPLPELSGLDVAPVGKGPAYVPDQVTPMPVLVIQVTSFKCGTVAVAVNWHHNVADGFSGVHFMKSWGEVARGEEISLKPSHDRSLLKPRPIRNHSLVRQYSSGTIEEALAAAEAESDTLPAVKAKPVSEPTVVKSFALEKEQVQVLKQVVQTEACDEARGMKFSTVVTISAHLWQSMTRARAATDDKVSTTGRSPETRFFMFVDGRKRLGLPTGFFGNVVCSTCATSSEEDIVNKPLSYTASRIHKAISSASADYFRSLIDWVEMQGLAPAKSDHVLSVGRDVAATFWTLFPLYDLNFGWGKPVFTTRNSPARPLIDGIAMMPSPHGAGNMVAVLNLRADRLSKLQEDHSFSSLYNRF